MDEVVIYSYLIIPLFFLFFKSKKKEAISILVYGVVFFLLLYFFYDIPKGLRKYYQSFYTFLEYSVFAYLISINIKSRPFKRVILLLSVAFVGFQIIYLFTARITRLDVLPVGIESILLFTYIFYFFYEQFNSQKKQSIYSHYCFWLSIGILIYLGGSFFINILANNMVQSDKDKYWILTYIAESVKNILFAVAIVAFSRSPNENIQKEKSSVPFLDMI